jgi:Fe-S-cluster containining protein
MSACDTCPKPGACCTDFSLNIGRLPKDDWQTAAARKMRAHNLPFIPLRLAITGQETDGQPAEFDGRVMIRFTCPLVTPEGRCGDYENRPQLCRTYQPKQDMLCALYEQPITIHPKVEA